MLWTTIALFSGLSLLWLQLQLLRERRRNRSRWLSGSLVVWGLNAWFALYVFANIHDMAYSIAKASLVGSAVLNAIIVGLALAVRWQAHAEERKSLGTADIVASGFAVLSLVGGFVAILLLWGVVFRAPPPSPREGHEQQQDPAQPTTPLGKSNADRKVRGAKPQPASEGWEQERQNLGRLKAGREG